MNPVAKLFDPTGHVGVRMIKAGASILAVPDPIPLVDEVIGAGLIIGGAGIVGWELANKPRQIREASQYLKSKNKGPVMVPLVSLAWEYHNKLNRHYSSAEPDADEEWPLRGGYVPGPLAWF